jgi:hypothetical protein
MSSGMASCIHWPPDYVAGEAFEAITRMATADGRRDHPDPLFGPILFLLADCEYAPLDKSSCSGATYKQLALIAHEAGMSADERRSWYGVAEHIGLTRRHAGHIIARIQDGTLSRAREAEGQHMGQLIELVFTSDERED